MTKIKQFRLTDYIIHNKENFLYKAILLILLYFVLFVLIIFQPQSKLYSPKIGEVVVDDIIADKEIRYIDKEATKQNEDVIKLTTPSVYVFDFTVTEQRLNDIDDLFQKIKDSLNYKDVSKDLKESDLIVIPNEYNFLKQVLKRDDEFTKKFCDIILRVSKEGIINLTPDDKKNIESTGIIIGKYEENNFIETLYSIEDINDSEKIASEIQDNVGKVFNNYDLIERGVIVSIINKFLGNNIIFNKSITDARISSRLKNSTTVYRKIKMGQVLIRKGDVVTKEDIAKIEALNSSKVGKIGVKYLLFVSFFLVFIFLFSYFFIKLCEKDFFKDMKNYTFISVTVAVYVLYLSLPIYLGIDKLNFYYGLFVPISTISLTFVFLYSQILSIFFSIILSIFFFVISGFNFSGFLFVFFSGICSVFTIAKVKKRADLILSGLLISLINVIIAVLIIFIVNKDFKIIEVILIAISNGIASSILGVGIIALGELILNSPTVFRLQELADTSSFLIKELFDSAVGTYNHSILVSNLAEAAASEVGANAMLAKVGGLYHDIGKIETPEYFIENQGDFNIHTQIKPSMSAAVIKAHVKRGVELAKKSRLPQKVIDIINQHHGNGLIKYFYESAQKINDANKGEIKEDVYRYSGETPKFVESAIVLLSDQVEAASRVLKKASMSNVEKLVENIVDEKFQEGILDDSGLTLKDLTRIKKVFLKLVVGMYHSRIEYPKDDNKEKDNEDKDGENK